MIGRPLILALALLVVGCDASADSTGFGEVPGAAPELRGQVIGGAAGAAGASAAGAPGTGGVPAPGGAGGMAGAGDAPVSSGSGGAPEGAGGAGAAGAPGSNGAGGAIPPPTYEACIEPGPASGCRRSSESWANGTPFLNGYKDGMPCVQVVIAETGLPGPSECTITTSAGNFLSVASCDECSFR